MALSTFALAVSLSLSPAGSAGQSQGIQSQGQVVSGAVAPAHSVQDAAVGAPLQAAQLLGTDELASDPSPGLVLSTRLVGHGCCSNASPPALSATLGAASADARRLELYFSGEGAPVGGSGWILLGAPMACSEDLGNGGSLSLDRRQLVRLAGLSVDAFGAWKTKVSVPAALADLAQGVVVQAMFPDPRMSIGFGLSDALELRLDSTPSNAAALQR